MLAFVELPVVLLYDFSIFYYRYFQDSFWIWNFNCFDFLNVTTNMYTLIQYLRVKNINIKYVFVINILIFLERSNSIRADFWLRGNFSFFNLER